MLIPHRALVVSISLIQSTIAQRDTTSASPPSPTELIPSTTAISLFDYSHPEYTQSVNASSAYADYAGSIVSVDQTSNITTLVLNCRQDRLSNCPSPNAMTTYSVGPSTLGYTMSSIVVGTVPSVTATGYTRIDRAAHFNITSSTVSAFCSYTTSGWASFNGSTIDLNLPATTEHVAGSQIVYQEVLVTAGVEKLFIESPTTTVSQDTDPTETESSGPEREQSPSRAWIAGPIIGGVFGLVVVGLLVYWFLRRRQKQPPGSSKRSHGSERGNELGGDAIHEVEPGSYHCAPVELFTRRVDRSELPGPETHRVYEIDT